MIVKQVYNRYNLGQYLRRHGTIFFSVLPDTELAPLVLLGDALLCLRSLSHRCKVMCSSRTPSKSSDLQIHPNFIICN